MNGIFVKWTFMPDFKNALATLRHMEKIRGENLQGKVVLKLW
jgi:hypothetical protein